MLPLPRASLTLLCSLGLLGSVVLTPLALGGCSKDDNGVVEVPGRNEDDDGGSRKPNGSRGDDDAEDDDAEDDDSADDDDANDDDANDDAEDDDTGSEDDDVSQSDDDEPADDDSAPADDDVEPADDDSAPSDDDVEPADDDVEPADDDSAPADDDAPVGGAGSVGGGGASSTGGTPVTPTGGSGTGGSAPQPAGCGPGVIDDFSTCDEFICASEGRTAEWFAFAGDGIGLDEEQQGVRYPTSDWSDPSCAMMLAGGESTAGTEYYAGVGFALADGEPYDLSGYQGVRFTIETSAEVDFTIRTAADEYFVDYEYLGLTTGAQTFSVDFASMVARSDNEGAVLNLAYAKEFQWTIVSPELGFGLALHHVELY